MPTPKIILFDVETSPLITTTFTLYPNNGLHHSNIIKDWYLITICWKELGKKQIHSVSVLDDPKRFKKDISDDYHVVKEFAKVLAGADAVIGHNVSKFDIKKFNTRLIYHKLPPLPKVHEIDTLKLWKKVAGATSNRLDYLGKFLGFGGKLPTSDGLWMRALNGEKSAINEMVKYCKVDVDKLEKLYLRMLPYIPNHPHIGAMMGHERERSCPNCGGTKLTQHKTRITAAGVKRYQKQCTSCGAYSTHLK